MIVTDPPARTSRKKTRGRAALEAMAKAARYRLLAASASDNARAIADSEFAKGYEKQGETLLRPAAPVELSCGEVIPPPSNPEPRDPEEVAEAQEPEIIISETLKDPDSISIDASLSRMQDALGADVLESAVDAAQSIRARNSLEKMLAHQMAAAHSVAMKLIARAFDDDRMHPLEVARLANAAARMMDCYQSAFLTLQKLRTGGKQTVVVQHVQISGGSQAVVAGSMEAQTRNGTVER